MTLFWPRFTIALLMITLFCTPIFSTSDVLGQDEAPLEPQLDAAQNDVEARLKLLDEVQGLLRENQPKQAEVKLTEFARGMTPETALAVIRKVGYEPFDNLIKQGGGFRRIALNTSALARKAKFREITDPEAIRQAVNDFLGEDVEKMSRAGRLLKHSIGEFSVPYLLEAWSKTGDYGVKVQIQVCLGSLGPRAVPPIITALDTDDAVLRATLIEVLSRHGDWRAAAKLRELAENAHLTRETRNAAMNACDKIVRKHTGLAASKYSASELYTMIAEDYLANRSKSVRNVIPRYYLNEGGRFLVWSKHDGTLVAAEVPRFAYNYEMAIRMAARAVELDPANQSALDVLVCARLAEVIGGRIILDYDDAMNNDLLTEMERNEISAALEDARAKRPQAVALGLRSLCGALRLALKYHLDEAAVECMNAIARVPAAAYRDFIPATEEEINDEQKYGDALTLALTVGSRRVRYRAAITLARIAASRQFINMKLVPELLLKAMKETGATRVLVVHPNAEACNTLRLSLNALGYDTIAVKDINEGIARATDFPAPDIIIAHNELELGTDHLIVTLRDNRSTAETPIMIVSTAESLEPDKLRFSYPNVKGFIIDPADQKTLERQLSAFKAPCSWEARQNQTTVQDAAEVLASLDPSRTTINLLPHVDGLIALAQGKRDLAARVSAMVALGNWRCGSALKPAGVILADTTSPKDLRVAAAHAIGRILMDGKEVDEETFGILLAALKSRAAAVSAAAGRALASAPRSAEQRSRIPRE